jgi:hypothetical protein
MLASVSSEAAPRSVVVLIWRSDPGVNGQCQQIVASNHFSAARKTGVSRVGVFGDNVPHLSHNPATIC